MFMKKAPEEIDSQSYPELACLQAMIHDQDAPPEGRWTTSPFISPVFQISETVIDSFHFPHYCQSKQLT